MKPKYLPWYALAAAVAFVAAVAIGVPAPTLLLLLIVSACPLMMLFMIGGHGGSEGADCGDSHRQHESAGRSERAGNEQS